ncbi:DUF2663 family protein [Desertibacillus haloalkaliphilus]|uniref:DUF2663 family protein n=1 Tax=Desertibacillus haloalkaliphilus TaxID=1328930 RepID=UPI001C25D82D|nr:DUF2663 family protein [Desertibacillus haloalkaliphilus]
MVVLQELIDKKQEEKTYEARKLRWSLTTFLCLGVCLLYIYFGQSLSTSGFAGSALHSLLSDRNFLFIVLLVSVCLMRVNFYTKKQEKAEDDYEALRIETVERCSELWDTPEQWNKREKAFQLLKETYGVNLYHK